MRRAIIPIALGLAACATPASIDRLSQTTPLGQTAPFEAWIATHPSASNGVRVDAYGALCDAYAREGHYRDAAAACERRAALKGNDDVDLSNKIDFWRVLSALPPIGVKGDVDVPLVYGWVGMAELPVTVNGVTMNWGVDTGAQVSVVSDTVAHRLGVRMFDQPLDLHGSTPGTANGKLGVIDRLTVGQAQITHVPVFVLPDAALTPMPDHVVPPILGVPVLYAYGRVEFLDHARRLHLTHGAAPPMSGRMTWNSYGVAIEVGLPKGAIRAFLDTGANLTEFRLATRELLTSDERSRLVAHAGPTAGVSGLIQHQSWALRGLDVNVGGARCRLAQASFGDISGVADDASDASGGRLGIDLVKACREFVLDFSTMTFDARE